MTSEPLRALTICQPYPELILLLALANGRTLPPTTMVMEPIY